MKKVKMSNIDFIRKWETNEDDLWTITVIDGEIVREIDEESELVYTTEDEISFSNLEKYNVWVSEVYECELDTNYKEFYKYVKKAKTYASKSYYGSGYMFSQNGFENFMNEEELEYLDDLTEVFEAFNRELTLLEVITVEENKGI